MGRATRVTWLIPVSHYTRDTKQLEALKPLDVLKPRLLDLFVGESLKEDASPQGSGMGPLFSPITSFTASSVKGGNYPFSLDLATAVCASPLTAWCSR